MVNMNSKTLLAVLLVGALVLGGAGAYLILSDDGNTEDKEPTIKGRCVIYGNTNNDDYLNQADLTLLKEIVNEGNWDYKLYPYADANHDGAVDGKDIDYLDNILNKKNPTRMYYVGMTGSVYDIAYPAVGNIGVNEYYGFYNASAVDMYDRITAASSVCLEFDEKMFPGCSKLDMVGTAYKFDPELLMKHDVKFTMGYSNEKIYDQYKPMGIDVIMLNASGVSDAGIDVIGTVITLGTIFDRNDAVEEYKTFFDKVLNDINETAKQIPREYTFVMPYCPESYVENWYDTEERATGAMLGDVYAMSLVPMKDLVWSANSSCPKIQTEDVLKWDPDYIVISNVDYPFMSEKKEVIDEKFNHWAQFFDKTNAYKNKQVIGINYESVGCAFGLGCTPLVCSYIWPDYFDEAEGLALLEETLKKFTELDFENLEEECPGLLPWRMA